MAAFKLPKKQVTRFGYTLEDERKALVATAQSSVSLVRKVMHVAPTDIGRLNSWVDYERNVREDFENVFGEPPGALLSGSVMTDSDNTQSNTKAWYGPLTLVQAEP